MKSLTMPNGYFLVANDDLHTPRFAYFTSKGKFTRYTSRERWNQAVKEWGIKVDEIKTEKFIFPSFGKWNVASATKTNAGKLLIRWDWNSRRNRNIPKTLVCLNDKKIARLSKQLLVINDEIVRKINLVHKWHQDGFREIEYAEVLNGWPLPITLINNCFINRYNDLVVKMATEFIGVEEPKNFMLIPQRKQNENKDWGIKINIETSSGKNISYFLYLDGRRAKDHEGTLECSEHLVSDEDYKKLLWVFLNPLKKRMGF